MKKILLILFVASYFIVLAQKSTPIIKKGKHINITLNKDVYKKGDTVIIAVTNNNPDSIYTWYGRGVLAHPSKNCQPFQKKQGNGWVDYNNCNKDSLDWIPTHFAPGETKFYKHIKIVDRGTFQFRFAYRKNIRKYMRNLITGNSWYKLWVSYSKEIIVK